MTIITSDRHRPEIVLTIKGEYTRTCYAVPDELTFGQIAGNKEVAHEALVLCNSPKQQLEILGHQMSDTSLQKFFRVDTEPLGADELRKHKGATSGQVVRVTIKPGLPLGRFQQRILLTTNLDMSHEIDLPVFGSVGEVSIVAPGWSSETGILEIGAVDGSVATERKLIVLARGESAKEMKFKVVSVEPDFLKVKLGKTTVAEGGDLSQTELLIEIPDRKSIGKKAMVNYMGGDKGKLGEILVETRSPELHSVRILVRFAVAGGN